MRAKSQSTSFDHPDCEQGEPGRNRGGRGKWGTKGAKTQRKKPKVPPEKEYKKGKADVEQYDRKICRGETEKVHSGKTDMEQFANPTRH